MDWSLWNLDEQQGQLERDLAEARDSASWAEKRNAYLSKKSGLLGQLFAALKQVPVADKPRIGKELNQFKLAVEALFASSPFEEGEDKGPHLDLSLPGVRSSVGSLHPLTLTKHEMCDYFVKMGYDLAEGPELETAFYNFEALNTPADHPARAEQDTFYIEDDLMLRTQTSGVQIRYMQNHQPPFRMVAPGRVYRRDDDVTHSPMFQQLEGLVVGEGIHFGHLRGTLLAFARHMFGEKVDIRLRPSYFPFTEPSAEVDVSCPFCEKGCRVCKNTRWIEVLGCGMVDPNVFAAVGYDSERYTGFAFGMGIERFAMLRYQVPDIRYFYQNDRRFLDQFRVE